MKSSPNPARKYAFDTPIDLLAALTTLNIQYLDVNETRVLVIFNTAILNLESLEGELTSLSSVEIEVYELPHHVAPDEAETAARSVLESFIAQLSTAEAQPTPNRE